MLDTALLGSIAHTSTSAESGRHIHREFDACGYQNCLCRDAEPLGATGTSGASSCPVQGQRNQPIRGGVGGWGSDDLWGWARGAETTSLIRPNSDPRRAAADHSNSAEITYSPKSLSQ